MPVILMQVREPGGPLLPTLVGHPSDDGSQPMAQRERLGLVDTGAGSSFIDASLAAEMGLEPVESTSVVTPSTATGKPSVVYEVSLCVRHPAMETLLRRVRVIEAELAPQGFSLILGRDSLQHFLVIYNGTTGVCTLAL